MRDRRAGDFITEAVSPHSASGAPPAASLPRRHVLRALTAGVSAIVLGGCKALPSLSDAGSRPNTIRVEGEFGKLRTAIVHDGSTARDFTMEEQRRVIPAELLSEHPETAASSRDKLTLQHEAFCKLLADNGVRMVSAVPQPGAHYQIFARDPAFAVGNMLFVARMRDAVRQAETAGLRDVRTQFPNVSTFSGGTTVIEGGDVIVMDRNRVLVGTHRNTNEAGFLALSAALQPAGIEAIQIPHRALHLDCCFASLPDGSAMIAAAKLPESSVATLRKYYRELIVLDPAEASMQLAANLFWIDPRRVVSGVGARKTNAMLRARGFRVIELEFSQAIALWGSFRCAVCPLERDT